MNGPDECAQAYVRHEILSYLDRKPRARDTVDGIIDWWLYEQRLLIGRETVLSALDQLVSSGMLDRYVLPPATVLYAKSRPSPSSQTPPQPDKE